MKQLLMIYTCFSPENAIGSIRTTKIAKYLVRQGFQITLISPELHAGMMLDDSLDCPELRSINRIYVPYGQLFSKGLLKRRNAQKAAGKATPVALSTPLKTVKRSTIGRMKTKIMKLSVYPYTLFKNISWLGQVKRRLRTLEGSFDVALSSYPSISSHWGCMYAKKIELATRWLADFRDPLTYEHSSPLKRIIDFFLLRQICAYADRITIISKDMADRFPRGETQRKLCYLPNGFDPEDHSREGEREIPEIFLKRDYWDKCLVFIYTGGLYAGKRNLEPLFRAMSVLFSEGVIPRERVKFLYAGGEFNVLWEQASFHGCTDILENCGYINRGQAMAFQRAADIAIACTHNTKVDHGILTGKIYEYFQNARQILAIVNGNEPGSELGLLIREANSGFCFEEAGANHDFDSLKAYITKMFFCKVESGAVPDQRNTEAFIRFQYPVIAKNLIDIFSEIK